MPDRHDYDIIDRLRTVDLGEEPPFQLDVAAARRTGARIRRRRQLAAAAATTVAVVAAAGLTAGALAARTPEGARVPAGPPTALQATPVTRLDPMVQQVDWGWVPAGFSGRVVHMSPLVEQLTLNGKPMPQNGEIVYPVGATLVLTVPGGQDYATPVGRSEPAPDVNGTPAVWVTSMSDRPDGSKVEHPMLSWAWTPGGQATLSLRGPETPDDQAARDEVLRMARSLRLDARKPVRFPFTVTGLTDLKPCQSTVSWDPTSAIPWTAGLELTRTGTCADDPGGHPHALGIEVSRSNDLKDARGGKVNTRIGRYYAIHDRTPDHDYATLFRVNGCQVAMTLNTADLGTVVGSRPPVTEMVQDIRPLDSTDDPAYWTTQPLR
jgi:hypothetical protein